MRPISAPIKKCINCFNPLEHLSYSAVGKDGIYQWEATYRECSICPSLSDPLYLYEQYGIGYRYSSVPHLQLIEEFPSHTNPIKSNVILFGGVGTGKTYHLSSYCKYKRVRYRKFSDLFQMARTHLDEIQDIKSELCNVDFLVLDDLGVDRPTEFAVEVLNSIVDTRYSMERPILMSTNIHPDKLSDGWGKRIADRLIHNAIILSVGDINYRRINE